MLLLIRGLLRGEATAFQAAKVGSTPTVRSSLTAPPVTRWGFRVSGSPLRMGRKMAPALGRQEK